MWRLWLFLALIGLLIWAFARLQQRGNNLNDQSSDEGSNVGEPTRTDKDQER